MKVYTCSWLEELSNKFGKKLIYVKQLAIKPTSEYILHIILKEEKTEKKYICALAFNVIQQFRLEFSLRMIGEMIKEFGVYYHFNTPKWQGELRTLHAKAVIYDYLESAKSIDNHASQPIEILDEIYAKSQEVSVDEILIEKIKETILANFPPECRKNVESSEPYIRYMDLLRDMDSVKIGNAHLDYSPSNILMYEDNLFLVDFEQGAEKLPIGYDKLHYQLYNKNVIKEQIPYYELNCCLYDIFHLPKELTELNKYNPQIKISVNNDEIILEIEELDNVNYTARIKRVKKNVFCWELNNEFILPFTFKEVLKKLASQEKYAYVIYSNSPWYIKGAKQTPESNWSGIYSWANLRGANILLRQADKGYKSKLWRKYM